MAVRGRRGRPKKTVRDKELLSILPRDKGGGDTSRSPWTLAKREKLGCQEILMSVSPRVATIAAYGPNVLLRPCVPDVLEAPQCTLSEQRLAELTQQQQARRLGSGDNLAIGGHGKTLQSLAALRALGAEGPEELEGSESLEPLRAMALKEVTNLEDLEALSKLLDFED